jgi:hypothetical protein
MKKLACLLSSPSSLVSISMVLVFINAYREFRKRMNTIIFFYPGVFQNIVFIYRKIMVKETDNSPSSIY